MLYKATIVNVAKALNPFAPTKPVLIAAMLFIVAGPAHALKAGDVVEKMTSDQFGAWLVGSADMAAQLFTRLGDAERARCVLEWSGGKEQSVREIDATFRANPSLEAAAVLEILMKRHCGEYK